MEPIKTEVESSSKSAPFIIALFMFCIFIMWAWFSDFVNYRSNVKNESQFIRINKEIKKTISDVESIKFELWNHRSEIESYKNSSDELLRDNIRLSSELNDVRTILIKDMTVRWWCHWDTIPYKIFSEREVSYWMSDYYVVSYMSQWIVRLPKGKKDILCLKSGDLIKNK